MNDIKVPKEVVLAVLAPGIPFPVSRPIVFNAIAKEGFSISYKPQSNQGSIPYAYIILEPIPKGIWGSISFLRG